MINKLSAFLLCLFLMACSNDSSDDSPTPPNSLKLKKVILTNINEDYVYIQYFNEDGSLHKDLGMGIGDNEEDRGYALYEYNSQKYLQKVKLYTSNNQYDRDLTTFEYDVNNNLIAMVSYGDGVHPPYNTTFTYGVNRIDFTETETSNFGALLFDASGKLIETQEGNTVVGGNPSIYQISYDSQNHISKIVQPGGSYPSTIYTFETDANPNPEFQQFIENPLQFMINNQSLYGIDFTASTGIFQNNLLKRIKSYDSTVFGIDETTYQYNSDNYPIISNTVRYNGNELTTTYEYY